MTWIDISLIIIAVSFCLLVFYLVKVLRSVNNSLIQTDQTIKDIQLQVDEIAKESTQLLQQSNKVMMDVEQKSKSLDPLFQTVHDAGQAVNTLSQAVREVSSTLSYNMKKGMDKATDNPNKIAGVMNIISFGYFIREKWKQRNKHND